MFKRIRYKITVAVGLTVTLGLAATAAFYTRHQEQAVLAQNERVTRKLTESVIQGLHSVMLTGSAEIAQNFAERLKLVPEVADFRILRPDGREAFQDNQTIVAVNRRLGAGRFLLRTAEREVRVLAQDDPDLNRAVSRGEPVSRHRTDAAGERSLTFIAPILLHDACQICHGTERPVLGAVELTTSLQAVEHDIQDARRESLLVLGTALLATVVLTGYIMRRSVVRPIEHVTSAMVRVSGGDLNHKVPIESDDELGRMAQSFNRMTSELRDTYSGLRREQDKLTTIIHSAGEGIVVTDGAGRVVLVNPAAERLLDKTVDRIVIEGIFNLLDDPSTMRHWLAQEGRRSPAVVAYKDRVLHVFASTIHNAEGSVTGSAALLRDITEEKRLEEELRRLSRTDGLTGLYNRRHLDETLAHELQRAVRTREPLAVIMCDVDHFKRFNDEHGHEQGDRVLQAVAGLMRDSLRGYDSACRYGGEEFLAILPGTDLPGAAGVAERLRREVEAARVDGLRVTLSLGVAGYPEIGGGVEAETLVAAADAALYRAKQAGRNRVMSASAAAQAIGA